MVAVHQIHAFPGKLLVIYRSGSVPDRLACQMAVRCQWTGIGGGADRITDSDEKTGGPQFRVMCRLP
jgi:hypothetical protein